MMPEPLAQEASSEKKERADEYIRKAQRVLPAPHILPQLLPLLNQPNRDIDKIVELISYESSLTANVMRICNSCYYSRGTPIESLKHAVMHIGLGETYRIVVAITGSVVLSAGGQPRSGRQPQRLWHHSATTALAAQFVAEQTGEDQNIVFTAALLHDLGKAVFALEQEKLYEERSDSHQKVSLLDAEKELFGIEHAELGGRLMEAWRFPPSLVVAVQFHHQPGIAPSYARTAACVCVGDQIAYLLDRGYGNHHSALDGCGAALGILGISPERLTDYRDQVVPRLKLLKDLFRL